MYVDESGIDTFISREYGWGPRGQKVIGEVSGKRAARHGRLKAEARSPR